MDNDLYKSIRATHLEYHPDCVYILPNNNILISTYDFINDNTKTGKMMLFNQELKIIDQIDTMGLLDFKVIDNKIIYACTVDSKVITFEVTQNKLKIINEQDHQNLFDNLKLLYIDASQSGYVIGGDNGQVIYFKEEQVQFSKRTHQYSVWCTLIDKEDQNVFYSGGDDGILLQYDLREPDLCKKQYKHHQTGITHIIQEENTIITGSFDQKMRMFDRRKLDSLQSEYKLGGEIWRICKREQEYLVGLFQEQIYQLIQIKNQEQFDILQNFKGHQSLTYGMDWHINTIITSSYYDKFVQIFKK